MTREEAIAIIENEKKCVNRANKNDYCNRDCYNCELVKTDIEILTALNMAIKALEQQSMPTMVYPQVEGITPVVVEPIPKEPPVKPQPCKDAISRQDAIKAINEKAKRIKNEDTLNGLSGAVGILFDLPSVNPQPKTGHWEWIQYDSNPNIGNWHCSECRTIILHMPEETDNTPIYKWCPMCGARMIES